jgi:hypothetical protein
MIRSGGQGFAPESQPLVVCPFGLTVRLIQTFIEILHPFDLTWCRLDLSDGISYFLVITPPFGLIDAES